MKRKWKIAAVLAAIFIAGIYYYIALPAINIHSSGFWAFLMIVIAVIWEFTRCRACAPRRT